METSRNKRGYEEGVGDADYITEPKKPKLPALASVIVEALKVDSMQRLSSSLEPMLRRIVSEEVERALTRIGNAELTGSDSLKQILISTYVMRLGILLMSYKRRSEMYLKQDKMGCYMLPMDCSPNYNRCSPLRIQSADGRNQQLLFRTRMPPHLFTGGKVEGEQGAAIHVVLLDVISGNVVQTGPESATKLNVVVLEGDFNEEGDEDWTKENFANYEVKEREGKRLLLTGELQVSPRYCEGIRVREAKTEAFAVKDHRGELYKKHYPPALHDEVWRLDRIAKDGALHKKLLKAEIVTVEDFLRLLVRDPQRLRNILGSGTSNRMWENTVEPAKTCVLGGKLYVYYTDQTNSTGVVFNHIYELRGLIADGQFLPLESLNHNQKVFVDSLVKRAYGNWHLVIEYDDKVLNTLASTKGTNPSAASVNENNYNLDYYTTTSQKSRQHWGVRFAGDWSRPRNGKGLEDFFAEEIRLRSSEMLETDDMQRLPKTFGVGVGMGAGFGHSDEACYTYTIPHDHQMDHPYGQERGKGSGKAVVGWLKLKGALRWGIFVRKRAAERSSAG
ncbi:hypothetical protein CRYUN_Cryun02cG0054200 [Craigia yunnanensis]